MSSEKTFAEWQVYRGGGEVVDPEAVRDWLDAPPPWRQLDADAEVLRSRVPPALDTESRRGHTYVTTSPDEVLRVNIALMLRRPLLVSGAPGLGKSSLAYAIATALGLGAPLRWEISSQTTLRDGLYSYDAVGHLQSTHARDGAGIASFITLGPLGTALVPSARPRVLLVDEVDKASFDLPNDLLHVFEEGAFSIPELIRAGGTARVHPADERERSDPREEPDLVTVRGGRVRTRHHPVVVITSNGEREFPEAFLRRCVQLTLVRPDPGMLAEIVRRQLPAVPRQELDAALAIYDGQNTDVILQALFLRRRFGADLDAIKDGLRRRTHAGRE